MGVKACGKDHQLWGPFCQMVQYRCPSRPHGCAAAAFVQRHIDDLAKGPLFARRARSRIKRHLMAGDKTHAGFVPKQILRAIAVVNVKIKHGDAREAMRLNGVLGCDCHRAEQTKAHRGVSFGVMAGGACGNKGPPALRHHRVHSGAGPSNRTQGGVQRSGRQVGIAIHLSPPGLWLVGRDARQILSGMAQQDVGLGAQRAGAMFNIQAGQTRGNGAKAFCPLWVTKGRDMAQAVIMAENENHPKPFQSVA